ncbi:MAG: hypothetical protein K1X64_13150 [Myxococcaceae bacterium]|nr:hypothetical protein [Myxococcaceae bacterium]
MAAPPPAEAAVAAAPCPITDDFLPPQMRKHVDPKAPVPLRMMAAKTLVPLTPPDMLGALFMLTFDPDAAVRETAVKTAGSLPDRILATAFREERIKPPVLAYFLDVFWRNDAYAEMLILNAGTPDEAVAEVAAKCGVKTAEIIAQNQLRLLRYDDIVRKLCTNPSAVGALIDGVCDFAVRSGLQLLEVPQMKAARIRLFGPEAAQTPPDPGPTADEILSEFKEEMADEGAPPLAEGKRMTLSQRIMRMSISEKIKLATKGNKEARSILIRDSNKLVCVAVIRSPRITDGEVLLQANNKTANDEVLRIIYRDREWVKQYSIKLALVKNPKVPQAISMKFLMTLQEADLKGLARSKNVPGSVQLLAKKTMEKKEGPKR